MTSPMAWAVTGWVDRQSPGDRVRDHAGVDVVASEGKSHDSVRSLDLDPRLVAVLRAQRKLQAEERLAAATYEDSGYVFTKPDGGAYHPQYLSRMLGRITAELDLHRLTAHGLRHTCATLMLANEVRPRSPPSSWATPTRPFSPTCTAT